MKTRRWELRSDRNMIWNVVLLTKVFVLGIDVRSNDGQPKVKRKEAKMKRKVTENKTRNAKRAASSASTSSRP